MSRRTSAAAALLLAACSFGGGLSEQQYDSLTQEIGKAPDFALTERSGRTVRRADLDGKVWVVSFFFTACAKGCPQTTANMARLQKDLADLPNVVLVSISVNPAADTPERLREYANSFGADPQRWLFLTGKEDAVYSLVEKGFFQSVKKNAKAEPGFEVDHTFRMIVVDDKGVMRGFINDGKDAKEVESLARRVRELAPPAPAPTAAAVTPSVLPTVNACLNAICTVLLVAGYVAIRRRRIALHKSLMLAALAVSAAFLASYLYYHFVIGRQIPFAGTGAVRAVYFVVLITHVVLAAAVAPLALTTAYLGLRGRLDRHMKLARWTLPIWLYVSVTGVIVYWMLYHLYAAG